MIDCGVVETIRLPRPRLRHNGRIVTRDFLAVQNFSEDLFNPVGQPVDRTGACREIFIFGAGKAIHNPVQAISSTCSGVLFDQCVNCRGSSPGQ